MDGADLTIYFGDEEQINLSLSPIQLKTIIKVLGLKITPLMKGGYQINQFSDTGLKQLWEIETNPFKLKEK